MSWGIDFKADVYLARQDYGENQFQVQDKIDELKKDLTDIEAKLKMFASANPKDIVPDDWKEEKIRWISKEVDELMENYRECSSLVDKLYLYHDYLNSKNEQ